MATVTDEQRAGFAALTAEQRAEVIDALSAAAGQVNHPGNAYLRRVVRQLRPASAVGVQSSRSR